MTRLTARHKKLCEMLYAFERSIEQISQPPTSCFSASSSGPSVRSSTKIWPYSPTS